MLDYMAMTKPAALLLGLLTIVGCAVGCAGARPHIVMFVADDHGWRDSEPYGNQEVRTPNRHAFAASPSCVPSRSAMYTSLYPARNGAHPNHSSVRPGITSLPHDMKPLGYRVVLVGKSHVKPVAQFPFEYVTTGTNQGQEIAPEHWTRIIAEHGSGGRREREAAADRGHPRSPRPLAAERRLRSGRGRASSLSAAHRARMDELRGDLARLMRDQNDMVSSPR